MIKRPSRNHLFILIALVLISCFVFTYAASAALSFADQTHLKETPTPLSETPSVDDIGTSIQQENNTLITEEEALSLAMPAIEQFAQENGLTVKSVNASLAEVKDLNGLRGGSTLGQVLQQNLTGSEAQNQFATFPSWQVTVSFYPVTVYRDAAGPDGEPVVLEQSVLMGYSVSIWADTGEIYSSQGGQLTE